MSGVVRVVYGCETGDFLGDYGHVTQWSVMQLGFAVMCTCMPCFHTGLPVDEANGGDRLVWLVFRIPEQPNGVRMPSQSQTPNVPLTTVPQEQASCEQHDK
ncbi:uncharacterized protein BO72DRAFT_508639 [Aspergillus fijiensis CBS 313.89]|uniref:Uncharacterized protein n=1 Tax=Aspergillus fijiensis CBS 313.89 TaxID=1448319 RepID=A0A8G1RS70_9EURO|nr:uncharacterized protein BO72DRAFT_508639 [Aspergillus fijiensis CBS 313.89]RAK77818.1 hypothetical protein BO72DRAFT_508639 [Aspergillus fijiensis CBS 313.89]